MRENSCRAIFAGGVAVLLAGLLMVGGCKGRTDSAVAPPASAWPALVNEWIESDLNANPTAAAYQGRHEFDGLFPDWSEAGLAAEVQRLNDWQARVKSVDATGLTAVEKFEREQLLAIIGDALFWRVTADWPRKNPTWYYIDPSFYLDRPYADLATRMKAYTRWASNLPRAAAQIKGNLKGPLPRAYIDIGLKSFGPLADFLKQDVVKVFAGAGDAAAQAEFALQTEAAAAALTDLHQHLEGLRATQTENFAMGSELFSAMLKATELVDTPLAEMEAIGLADLKRNQAAMVEVCRTFAPGKTIPVCVAKMKDSKPEGGDVLALATSQLADLKRFVLEKQIVSIPGEEVALVKQSPPYDAQNFASIDIPGPYEKGMPSFYKVTAPDPSWSKAKQRDYIPGRANLLLASVHEVWPGHFLQFLHANRVRSSLGRLYVGYASSEGWAHYAEELMWEEGLANGDAETHVAQLMNAVWRNVRLLSAIGLHARGMTQAESKRMFITDSYLDEGNAEQQAARGTYDPAYLNYTMGKLLIRKLRTDWCGQRSGAEDRACWRDFHDAFLSYGGPPIPLVRAAMMQQPLRSVF